MDTEEMVRRYFEAVAHNDFDTMQQLRHPDWHEDWPQSGERIPSHEAYREIHEDFPSGMPRIDTSGGRGLRGPLGHDSEHDDSADRRQRRRLVRGGREHVRERRGVPRRPAPTAARWPVWRSTTYFAAPFEAPAWRAQLVVPIE